MSEVNADEQRAAWDHALSEMLLAVREGRMLGFQLTGIAVKELGKFERQGFDVCGWNFGFGEADADYVFRTAYANLGAAQVAISVGNATVVPSGTPQ